MDVSFTAFPTGDVRDPEAYKTAIDALKPGDAITIFTPDTTHFPIALYAIQRKIHVLITKPATKTLEDHLALIKEADKQGVFVYVEHHKRQARSFDLPILYLEPLRLTLEIGMTRRTQMPGQRRSSWVTSTIFTLTCRSQSLSSKPSKHGLERTLIFPTISTPTTWISTRP